MSAATTVKTDAQETTKKPYEWEYAKNVDDRPIGQKVKEYLYNPNTKSILGNTWPEWRNIILLYSAIYLLLAVLFYACMRIMIKVIKKDEPYNQLEGSFFGSGPGLSFHPHPEMHPLPVIHYKISDTESIQKFVNTLDVFLTAYNNRSDDKMVDCSVTKTAPSKESKKYCAVPLQGFGQCSKNNTFGYKYGQPCVFVKLNKVYNWKPDIYEEDKLPPNVPQELKLLINKEPYKRMVWISCNGIAKSDQENVVSVEYYPYVGLPNYYFPYVNTPGYLSPLVSVQFSVKKNVLVNVECFAWARNIVPHESSQTGSFRFAIKIDE